VSEAHVIDAVDEPLLNGSYSADRIGDAGVVRPPLVWRGSRWVCTGIAGGGPKARIYWAYRLLRPAEFAGPATTYRERTKDGSRAEAARSDPMGFYHGMTVKSGGQEFVICGPEVTFTVGAEVEQLVLL
jgi:hypothetical protein